MWWFLCLMAKRSSWLREKASLPGMKRRLLAVVVHIGLLLSITVVQRYIRFKNYRLTFMCVRIKSMMYLSFIKTALCDRYFG